MLRQNHARFLGLTLTAALLVSGCKRGHDSDAKADARPDDTPALMKAAPQQQGDATRPGRLQKSEAPTLDQQKAAQPVADTSDDEKPAKDKDDASDDDDGKTDGRDSSAGGGKHRSRRDVESTASDDKPATKLTLKRIQFSEEIAKREPVNAEETFSAAQTQKLYAFVEIDNPDKKRSRIIVNFVPPMGSPSKVELRVGDKSRWRTWALRRTVKAVGTWTVIVSDPKGGEIGRRTFEVTE